MVFLEINTKTFGTLIDTEVIKKDGGTINRYRGYESKCKCVLGIY